MKMGEEKGLPALPRHRQRTNGVSVRPRPHAACKSGPKPAKCRSRSRSTATSPSSRSATDAPVEPLYLKPVVALGLRARGVALRAASARRAAVPRFHDPRDGQEIMAKRDMTPTNPKIRLLPEGVDLTHDRSGRDARQPQEVGRPLDQYRAQATVAAVPTLYSRSSPSCSGRRSRGCRACRARGTMSARGS